MAHSRLGAAALLPLLLAACDDGRPCPAGETCSALDPGLAFRGQALGDGLERLGGAPFATARGGRQRVRVVRDAPGNPPFAGFEATAGGPAFAVVTVDGNLVEIEGLAAGADYLRLLEPGTGRLHGRLLVEVDEVARVVVVPSRATLRADLALFEDPTPDLAFHAALGEQADLTVALLGATDDRLVAAGATITAPGTAARPGTWDGLTFAGPPVPGDHTVTVTVGGASVTATFTVVDAIDALGWVASDYDDRPPQRGLAMGDGAAYCFGASLAGRPVVGAPVTLEVQGLAVDTVLGPCAFVYADREGTATITATSGAIVTQVSVPVAAAPSP
jgi:hypothetical protein